MATAVQKNGAQYKLNYQVPSSTGGLLPAHPVNFCLKYKPPTIAIVYQFESRPKKYVHEIKVDLKENTDIQKLCEELCRTESIYLNPSKVSQQQVKELLMKLYDHQFKGKSNKENLIDKKEEQQQEQRKPNFFERKRFNDKPADQDNNNSSQEDNLAQEKDKHKAGGVAAQKNQLDDFDDDDDNDDPWDMDDFNPNKKNNELASKAAADAGKKDNPFDKKPKAAFEDLDDIDFGLDSDRKPSPPKQKQEQQKALHDVKPVSQAKPQEQEVKKRQETDDGLFVDNDFGDDFEDEYEDDDFENNDKDNKDIFENSRTKEAKGSAAASANKSGADDHPLIQEATNKGGAVDNKLKAQGNLQPDTEEEEEDLEPEDQAKMIQDQFNLIYQNDEQLRQVLGTEAMQLTLEEKYQILQAYMHGGGVKGLLAEEDEDGANKEGGADMEMDPEEEKMVKQQFNDIYTTDAKLREVLGPDASALSIKEKYQILIAYKQGGGVQGLLGEEEQEDEESVIVHKGKKFRRVQIEGENQEYLMDEEGNIYDTEFNFIGQANPSDEEDGE